MAFGARTNTQRPSSRGGGGPHGGGVPPSDPVEVARSIGLNLLSLAPKSRAQLAEAMRARGVPADAAAQVLDRFTEVGLIDDVAFADAWVTSRQSVRGLAPRALATELRRKGIAEPAIAGALAEVSEDDVEESARSLVARRLRSTAGLPAQTRIRRLTGFLNRKGYPGQLAYRVVREALEAEGDEVGDLDVDVLNQES